MHTHAIKSFSVCVLVALRFGEKFRSYIKCL